MDARPPETRWWYWVAAVPAVAGFWLLSWCWLAVAVGAEFGGGLRGGDPVSVAFDLSALLVALPFAVVLVVAAGATRYDASALRAAGADVDVRRWTALAVVPVGCAVAGYLVAGPATFVLGGALAGVPTALAYLRERRRAVGVPRIPGRRR